MAAGLCAGGAVHAVDCSSLFVIETVAPALASPMNRVSLAVTDEGVPNISYFALGQPGLSHARRNGENRAWDIEHVADLVELSATMLLSAAGEALISYNSSIGLSISKRNGGRWNVENLSPLQGLHHQETVIGTDGTKHSCLLWSSSGAFFTGNVSYGHLQEGVWSETLIEVSSSAFAATWGSCDIALDSKGEPHICSINNSDHSIRYWHGPIFGRQPEIVALGRWGSLGLNATDQPYVSYHDWTTKHLMIARREGTAWTTSTIDPSTDVGQYSSMIIDSRGTFHVAYYDAAQGHLKYARRQANRPEWQICVIDSTGDSGVSASLKVDASHRVHIAYFDLRHNSLKYAVSPLAVAVKPTDWSRFKSKFRE